MRKTKKKNNDKSLTKIIKTAISLFSKKWYSTVSIAEICRNSEISNGLFYHYFQNKEELIKSILDKTVNEIDTLLSSIKGESLKQKINNLIRALHSYTKKNKELILVFREGQYRYFEYERILVNIYKNTLKKILNKDISLSLYLFVFGSLRFSCIRNVLYGSKISIDALEDILLNGIFNNSSFDVNKVFKSIKRSDYDYSIKSKDRIIESGKNLFGKLSYDEVNIHNIMENIGLASGTFYKYFTNKESFFELLVEISGKHIRHFISENLSDDLNRLEREIRGIFLFINYLNFDRNCYNIVREAEFVNRKKAIEYYASFVQGYKKRGLEGLNNEKLRQIPNYNDTVIEFLLGISHYFGIEYIYSNENLTIDKILVDLAYLLKNGIGGLQK